MEQPLVQLDYKLILEKLYEATDEIRLQIKEFTMEIKNRNPALNLQTDSQTLSEHSMDQETTEAGLTKGKEDSILLHTQADEISEELKRTVIKPLTTLKLTEMDRQAQRTENDASLDKQLLATKLDVIEPATQQFQTWRLDFVKQQGIIYKGARFLKQKRRRLCLIQRTLQDIKNDLLIDIVALLWKPVWHKRKARIRFKNVIEGFM